jgi:hypothetical protein
MCQAIFLQRIQCIEEKQDETADHTPNRFCQRKSMFPVRFETLYQNARCNASGSCRLLVTQMRLSEWSNPSYKVTSDRNLLGARK